MAQEPEVYAYRVEVTGAPDARTCLDRRLTTRRRPAGRRTRRQAGHAPVVRNASIAAVYGAMSSPCAASHASE